MTRQEIIDKIATIKANSAVPEKQKEQLVKVYEDKLAALKDEPAKPAEKKGSTDRFKEGDKIIYGDEGIGVIEKTFEMKDNKGTTIEHHLKMSNGAKKVVKDNDPKLLFRDKSKNPPQPKSRDHLMDKYSAASLSVYSREVERFTQEQYDWSEKEAAKFFEIIDVMTMVEKGYENGDTVGQTFRKIDKWKKDEPAKPAEKESLLEYENAVIKEIVSQKGITEAAAKKMSDDTKFVSLIKEGHKNNWSHSKTARKIIYVKGQAKIDNLPSKTTAKKSDSECDELIQKEKERKKKAKEAAAKRASEPKKTEATKGKEVIEKQTKKVEKRAEKGLVSKAEIQKLIKEHEAAIKKLRSLLEKASKMEKGGSLGDTLSQEHSNEFHEIKEQHCGCKDH